MNTSTLVFAWGNPSRGDDAIGPLFVERLAAAAVAHPHWGRVECLTDFQLQVEHALDLRDRDRVLFVDASLTAAPPFEITRLEAARDISFTTHAISPQAVLQVYRDICHGAPPPAWLLAIRGARFELGSEPSESAARNLDAALDWTAAWLGKDPAWRYHDRCKDLLPALAQP